MTGRATPGFSPTQWLVPRRLRLLNAKPSRGPAENPLSAGFFLGVTLGMNVKRRARRHLPLTPLANPGGKTELDANLHG
jgi:hypothetical protein